MAGSGLQEVLELVYAKNAVGHMLNGKAIATAIRGHFLVDAALLVCSAFNIRLPVNSSVDDEIQTADELTGTEELQENATEVIEERQENATKGTEGRQENATEVTEEQQENATEPELIDEDLKSAGVLYKLLSDDAGKVEQVCSADVLSKIAEKLESKRKCMQNQRTAFLWTQYMGMVDIRRKFIRAERTGNWKMHLQAVHEMLPYFAACGHNLYAKSAYIYLQLMNDLQKKHSEVYNSFQDGLHMHVVRRSDRYWAGLSTDLVLMRSEVTGPHAKCQDVLWANPRSRNVRDTASGLAVVYACLCRCQQCHAEPYW